MGIDVAVARPGRPGRLARLATGILVTTTARLNILAIARAAHPRAVIALGHVPGDRRLFALTRAEATTDALTGLAN
jgi:hypothetical protein